jgi:hypothetical protein
VADGEEAIAEAPKPPKPNLADQKVAKRIRFRVKNQRDCGAASAVGAATVAISLLIGGGQVTVAALYILLGAQLLLIYTAVLFANLGANLMIRDTPDWVMPALFVGTFMNAAGIYLVAQLKQHESNAGSAAWWWLLCLAGLGALLGLIIRRSAESLLDQLDDESWEQRIAPLVSEQKRALEEMGGVRNAPAEAAGAGARVTPTSPGTFPPSS